MIQSLYFAFLCLSHFYILGRHVSLLTPSFPLPPCRRTIDDRFTGNGGLSLRRVSTIRRVLSFQERYNDTRPEDEWFGTRLWVLPGAKVAAGEDGQLAVEDTYIPNAMGFHLRDGGRGIPEQVWGDPAQRGAIFDYCPELSLIFDMKLQRERCPGDRLDGTFEEEKLV